MDVGFNYAPLIAGDIDAEWAFRVTAGIDLPAKGVDINILNPADYGIVTHGYTIFAREDTIQEKPELVESFLRAALSGVVATVNDPVAATDALAKRDPSINKDISLKRQKAYNAVTSASKEYSAGYMDQEMFASTYARLRSLGVIEGAFDVSTAFTMEFLDRIGNDYILPGQNQKQ